MFHRILSILAGISICSSALAQTTVGGTAFGIWIDNEGTVRLREADAKRDLAAIKSRRSTKDPALYYLSLAKTLADAKEAIAAGRPVSDELNYLHGLTQIRYILLYPDEHDI